MTPRQPGPRLAPGDRISRQELELHQSQVFKALLEGRLAIFLGAGASVSGRPSEHEWRLGLGLPSATELARYLTTGLDETYSPDDLKEAALAVEYYLGAGPLDTKLRRVFDVEFPPSELHACLARMPAWCRAQESDAGPLLIVTTNYDDLVERAFDREHEAYDIVYYTKPRGSAPRRAIWATRSSPYGDRSRGPVTIVLKIHGTIDRRDPNLDNYVISEDDYIDYLDEETEIVRQLPVEIQARLADAHVLFLGYGLRDWNVILVLRRFSRDRLKRRWWAVDRPSSHGSFEARLLVARWEQRGIDDVVFVDLADYAAALSASMDAGSQTHATARPR
jgi:hypothetical protein